MNSDIERLYALAQKPTRNILGLMSGTSVDGLDMALCRCTGSGAGTQVEVTHFETQPYDNQFREYIAAIFSKKTVNLELLTLLNAHVAIHHATIINQFLQKNNIDKETVDLVASHGQTIYHAPRTLHRHETFSNATLQIGDGDHLAVHTGIITISDFRQKHIAAGGEGAPLAVYGDYLVFGSATENRIMLNMGGIANFTWLPAGCATSEVFCTDTGPGNTIMDAYMMRYYNGTRYDEGGRLAASGTVHEPLLNALLADPFFSLPFPKTTGPEWFNLNYLEQAMQQNGITALGGEDIMATLNAFTAHSIAGAIKKNCAAGAPVKVFASGGGMHNTLLMNTLQQLLPFCQFTDTRAVGVHPDAKEAVLFALLANECVAGNPTGSGAPGFIPVKMGKISFPR
ncbi:MAG: anhydro-N-acetylmuramic acid kinase [Dinghuibacter sp.]|nr:anhydro-N-acetylmuramic acid kinase [Dinghuibacter sp.]